ncbi:MAG: Ig-like domain-containing protein [bacterium]|nr:Ig-like domain-containing protein [bacterium]
MRRKKAIGTVFLSALLTVLAFMTFAVSQPVFAQVTDGLQGVGDTVKLSGTDPRVIAVNIINASLGLLGIILVVIIIYAGFLYMTSGGVPEKTDTAKKWIRNAIIGLIIILSAWGITRFVIDQLLQATGGGESGIVSGGGSGGGGFTGGGISTVFQVKSVNPQGEIPIRNVVVKLVFSRPVDEATVSAIAILKTGATTVGGTLQVNGKLVTFTPADACPAPHATHKCFDANTDFTVQIGPSLRSSTGQSIACGGFAPACTSSFKTGNLVDTEAPTVSISEPFSGQNIPADSLVSLVGHAEDDAGISYVTFQDGAEAIDTDGPNVSPSPTAFDAQVSWNTAGLELQSVHTLKAFVFDLDGNTGESTAVQVVVRPPSCFNAVQDGDETGLDCGGTINTPGYCGACSGGSCSVNAECSSGVCQNNTCVDQPVITSVSPLDGKPGTFVTVSGKNLGANGQVVFLGGPGASDDITALPPKMCSDKGAKTWSATEVIVAVPEGASNGPIQITNGGSGLSDQTDNEIGPGIPHFIVNDSSYPGLCAVDPSSGFSGNSFSAIGSGFGSAPDAIGFGSATISSFASWTDEAVSANVPVSQTGSHVVRVHVGTVSSNPVSYHVMSKATAGPPAVLSIDPTEGPRGEYVTLFGNNFGWNKGTVRFRNNATQEEALADTNFPATCADTYWSSTNVVVKVPQQFLNNTQIIPGGYTVRLIRSDNVESNTMPFTVVNGNAKPGICSISPSSGPLGTPVTLSGERFGATVGNLTFFDGTAGIPTGWVSGEVKALVPVGAKTGPVVVTANGEKSNTVQFQVANCNASADICSPSQVCCANGSCAKDASSCGVVALSSMFAWQSSTGLVPVAPRVVEECAPEQTPAPVPSPSPWINRPGGDQVCVTATVAVRFTTHLDPTTVTPSTFHLKQCTGGGNAPCSQTSDVTLGGGSPYLQPASQDQDLVILDSANGLDPDTTYLVEVTTGLRGAGAAGAQIEERDSCGKGIGYCFQFKTRNSQEACKVGAVSVSPHPYELNDSGATVNYLASPVAENDKCVVLQCSVYDWAWEHGDGNNDGRAIFETPLKTESKSGLTSCRQVGVSLTETGDVPVNMNAIVKPDAVKGTGHLFVRFIPPHVISYAPRCSSACVNAVISATFNTAIDPLTVPGNVEVRACANENCNVAELSAPLPIPASNITVTVPPKSSDQKLRYLRIDPVVKGQKIPNFLLTPGMYYRVRLKGGDSQGIRGNNGVPMSGLNNPEGFVWTFRAKIGEDAYCTAEFIDVAPGEKIETNVGARQLFTATPFGVPDECSADGQALVQTTNASWATADANIANYVSGGTVDTGAPLPAQCGASCLWMGAQAEFGKVAVCGNGILETTDSKYCANGKTPYGDACSVLPSGAKAGEQCDPGIPSNVGLCDPFSCLWKPIPQVPKGTCGNGTIEQGEACDFGRLCEGASATSTTPNGTDCTNPAIQLTCETNGGSCAPRQYRGCSAFCRNTGSTSGKSTCGNLDVADGEDCDDGNSSGGDGCSTQCLHTGSSPLVASVCGNALLEPGESCEKPNVNAPFPAGCDAKSCLNVGSALCDNDPKTPNVNCCGNVTVEGGEDCDDGNAQNGDGCSVQCLFEGSSAKYAQPSFCSNGILEIGEQCEASTPGGDGLVDSAQLAEIIGNADPSPDGLMKTTLTADLESKQGTAEYGLQCGFTDEQSCAPGYGLSDQGCCYVRPELDSSFPTGSGACRNTLIKAKFTAEMDAESIPANAVIALQDVGPNCPSGMELVNSDFTPRPDGIFGWVGRVWDRIVAWVTGDEARAAIWCKGAVTGTWAPESEQSTSAFVFKLDSALFADTLYRVKFLGDDSTTPNPLSDNNDLSKKIGVRTSRGVVAPFDTSAESGPLTFSFTTGKDVCTANLIQITDTSKEHPLLFTEEKEQHPFVAEAISIQNNVAIPITPVKDYAWSWKPWTTSNIDVADVVNPQPNQTKATVEAKNQNGNAFVTAWIQITEDTIHDPSMVGTVTQGTAPITVSLCENPWPNLTAVPVAPFRDKAPTGNGQDSSLADSIFAKGPYFNFSTTYCRDAGATGVDDDLPRLKINFVPPTDADSAEGILRQYLFTYGADHPELKKDGVGIRIASNPLHLSPEDWYAWRGFGGSPQPLHVDGYRAIQDGTTTYIAAANTENPGERIYSNIYLISHNPDAEAVTVDIYDQMVGSFAFNINVTNGVANVCEDGNDPNAEPASPYLNQDGSMVRCSADYECLSLGDNYHCGSYKLKLARDTERVSDFQKMSKLAEASKSDNGSYPKLDAGTFVRTFSSSLWPSWQEELKGAFGADVPSDPVNRFATCGRCSQSQALCGTASDCSEGELCIGQTVQNALFTPSTSTEPLTCFDTDSRVYICPRIGISPSRVYHYRSVNNGDRYEIASEFEVPEPTDPNKEWWYPTLTKEVKRCVNSETAGFMCESDSDCRPCANPKDLVGCSEAKFPTTAGACRPVGGKFVYQDVCTNKPYGLSGTCGDGIIGSACSGGSNNGNACTVNTDCPGGSCSAVEACELGQTAFADCSLPNKTKGLKLQICNECKGFVDEPGLSACNASELCGNGKIDKICSGGVRNTLGCTVDSECAGDPKQNITDGKCVSGGESCDDGALNGTYGHCNIQCKGYSAFCGDGQISPGELCDLGAQNGQYCGKGCSVPTSCGLDCKSSAPYCGDKIITSPEQCDGQSEKTAKAICTAGSPNAGTPCEKDEECGKGGTCATGNDPLATCVNKTAKACATTLKQCVTQNYTSTKTSKDNKVCQKDADCTNEPGGKNYCRSAQEFVTSCVANEDCSIGQIPGACLTFPTEHVRTCNAGGIEACNFTGWSSCKVAGFCGDGVIQSPAEQCDNGGENGDTNACTSLCTKNVCGDAKPFIGVEECDAGSQNGKVTCSADYNSSCSSCSTQCKFLASSGGYCGDESLNGPEQCDGNKDLPDVNYIGLLACQSTIAIPQTCTYISSTCESPPCRQSKQSNVSCSSIGFDFALNGSNPDVIPLDSSTDKKVKDVGKSLCKQFNELNYYDYLAYKNCLGMKCSEPPAAPHVLFADPAPTVAEFWQCVREKGPSLGIGVKVNDTPELVMCSAQCTFGGCGKCSDENGNGTVEGQLIDAVYNQVIPFARISLMYKGVLVNQFSSDENGNFKVTGLNERSQCGLYKLVIDSYDDNPCTNAQHQGTACGGNQFPPWTAPNDVNEKNRGGYWPLETKTFGSSNYEEVVIPKKDGRIYLYPKPGAGEAYMTVLWEKDVEPQPGQKKSEEAGIQPGGFGNHLILPSGYTVPTDTELSNPNYPASYNATTCDYNARPASNHQCSRDITWAPQTQGNPDISQLPYAWNYCPHQVGEKVQFVSNTWNGCPVEGNTACLANGGSVQECQKGVTISSCSTAGQKKCAGGYKAKQVCITNQDCIFPANPPQPEKNGICTTAPSLCGGETEKSACLTTGGSCSPVPCQKTWWDSCEFYQKGPLTTYVRYAPFSGSTEPIHMMWDYWIQSVYPQLNGSIFNKDMKPFLQEAGFSAVISTDKQFVTITAQDVKTDCKKENCKFWYIGDVNVTNGEITILNMLHEGRPAGTALYESQFKGTNQKVNYCMSQNELYYQCKGIAQKDITYCKSLFGASATCEKEPPNYAQWSRANY